MAIASPLAATGSQDADRSCISSPGTGAEGQSGQFTRLKGRCTLSDDTKHTKKVDLGSLTLDDYIYPRKSRSPKTIEAYKEALLGGAEFPPIEVQRVKNYPTESGPSEPILIVDGLHRWLAYQENKVKQISVTEWRPDETLDYEQSKVELVLRAAECNTRHGDRLKDSDKEAIARQIAIGDPKQVWTEERIGQRLGVARQRVNEWITHIRARQKAGRNSKIVRLDRLGWIQQEIADSISLSQNRVSEIIGNTEFGKIDILLSEGRTMDYIADHFSMDLALAWALRLEGMTDLERFGGAIKPVGGKPNNLGWGLRSYDDWRFLKCDERFGDDWPGRIPAQLVAHALRFFTREDDLVMDPMAGGAVVPDVCLVFGRRCRAFDMITRDERLEIQHHYWELGSMEWPGAMRKKPDLIFFDPPYFTKKVEEYENAKGGEVALSSLPRDEYLAFFAEFFALAYRNSKPTTRLAFLIAPWRDYQSTPALEEDPDRAILMHHYTDLLRDAGWQITHEIQCPLSNARFNGAVHEQMQNARILCVVFRTLLIARRS